MNGVGNVLVWAGGPKLAGTLGVVRMLLCSEEAHVRYSSVLRDVKTCVNKEHEQILLV